MTFEDAFAEQLQQSAPIPEGVVMKGKGVFSRKTAQPGDTLLFFFGVWSREGSLTQTPMADAILCQDTKAALQKRSQEVMMEWSHRSESEKFMPLLQLNEEEYKQCFLKGEL